MSANITRADADMILSWITPENTIGPDETTGLLIDVTRDYIALLDENRILIRAIQDIAFGNLSPEENERIASDAWYTAARAAIERTTEQE